jgi:DNA polymerase III subunit gamma/tau
MCKKSALLTMSYIVFARKWRPLTFEDVVGQEHITETLKKAIEKDRVAHAYIFTGTRGVGKTTTARILARALNCEKGPTPLPCGTCDTCKNIINGSSFDVIEIDGASNNSVEDIREIRDNINYSSMGGNYRIYVIDEVHMLSKSAFNALLKTLEEPPPKVIFIFATTEPQKIPATIQSRCQRYDFRRISTEQIVKQLSKICTNEKIVFEPSALMLVARKADGSMRDSLSLLDQVYSYSQESILEKDVRQVLGLVDTEVYDTIMKAIKAKDPTPVLNAVQDMLFRGFDLHDFVVGFEEYLRTLLFAQIPGVFDNPRIELSDDSAGVWKERAAGFSDHTVLRMAEIIRKAENEIKWSAFPRFSVEIALLKLVYMDNTVSVEKLLETFKQKGGLSETSNRNLPISNTDDQSAIKKKLELTVELPAIVESKAEPASSAPEVSAEFDDKVTNNTGDPALQWPKFLELLQRERPMLGYYMNVAYITAFSGTSLDVRFPHSCHVQYEEITKKKNRDEINRVINKFNGAFSDLHITIEAEPVNQSNISADQPEKKVSLSINDEIEREPIIKTVLDLFNGEIID